MRNVFKNLFADGHIESFEKVTLRTSGMRQFCEYEIVPSGDESDVVMYEIFHRDGEEVRKEALRAVCPTERMIGILNECKVLSWDGFDGPHPKGVLDGEMFSFEASVNGGKKIRATGSQNFPKHYWEFKKAVWEILNS